MALLARINYCDGTTQAIATCSMTEESCPTWGTTYDDGVCVYNTRRKQLTFILSRSFPHTVRIRFNVAWSQSVDGGTPSTGTQVQFIDIPAGVTVYTWTQYWQSLYGRSDEWVCRETRTCNAGDDGVIRYESPQ